jgi:hypothetical protein
MPRGGGGGGGGGRTPQKIRAWFRRVKQNSVNFSLRDKARFGEIGRVKQNPINFYCEIGRVKAS